LYAYLIGTVTPYDFGFWFSIYFLVAIVIGGIGSIPGSLLGGAFITMVPLWLSGLRNLPNIVFGLALILVVLLFPGGLIGSVKYVFERCGRIIQQVRSENG
jgi:branched-chain amino acid transport system permease protein